MTEEKPLPTINPRTGKPFPKKFIESMQKNRHKFKEPRTEEQKKTLSATMKKLAAKKKTFQEVAAMILEMAPKPEIVEKLKEHLPDIDEKEITNRIAMMQRIIEKAMNGDLYAFQIVRDTAGEKPVEKQEVISANTNIEISKQELKEALKDTKEVLDELK